MSNPPVPIILASASPRRVELLSRLGLPFSVTVSGVDETVNDESAPEAMVRMLAERKAQAVAATLDVGVVIGADTTVVVDGCVLNKPVDDHDARRMLRLLRGRTHTVWTGVTVIDAGSRRSSTGAIGTLVRLRKYTDDDIDTYVATGEPLDKAGAYAIQGGAGLFVEAITGCYANVVGLPLCELSRMLRALEVRVAETRAPVCQLPTGEPCPELANPSRQNH